MEKLSDKGLHETDMELLGEMQMKEKMLLLDFQELVHVMFILESIPAATSPSITVRTMLCQEKSMED